MPLLGGVGTAIVLGLRSRSYFNPETGELRNEVEIDLPELAQSIGVSEATVKREFGTRKGQPDQLQNPFLHRFVTRERKYRRDPLTGQTLRTMNVYRVEMEDPIHELDIAAVRKAQNAPNECIAHFAPENVQNAPKVVQNAPETVQNAPPLKSPCNDAEATINFSMQEPSVHAAADWIADQLRNPATGRTNRDRLMAMACRAGHEGRDAFDAINALIAAGRVTTEDDPDSPFEDTLIVSTEFTPALIS